MANRPNDYPSWWIPPILNQDSSSEDFFEILYQGDPANIVAYENTVKYPKLNNYSVYWTGLATGSIGRVQAESGEYYKGYIVYSNDKRNLFDGAEGEVIGISGSTYIIHEVIKPRIRLDETTEIAASGTLTNSFDLVPSRSVTFDITIKRNPV